MIERENVTLAWRFLYSGSRAPLVKRAPPGPPARPDPRDLKDLEEDFRELGIPMRCLPLDERIHLSSVSSGCIELLWPDRPARSVSGELEALLHCSLVDNFQVAIP